MPSSQLQKKYGKDKTNMELAKAHFADDDRGFRKRKEKPKKASKPKTDKARKPSKSTESKPKARPTRSKASSGGPTRHKSTSSSTGGPARHKSTRSSKGGPSRYEKPTPVKAGASTPPKQKSTKSADTRTQGKRIRDALSDFGDYMDNVVRPRLLRSEGKSGVKRGRNRKRNR